MKKTKEENLDNEDYIEVYFSTKIRRQLYEIGYIKFYYLDYVVPSVYKYKDKNYKIIDYMWVNIFTGKKIKRRELAFLFQLLFSMFILMMIIMFILTSDVIGSIILEVILIIGLLYSIIIIWRVGKPPKSCRAMIKADYDSPPKNLLDQYQEKMSKKDRKKARKIMIKEKIK